jgi:hypothetical protein
VCFSFISVLFPARTTNNYAVLHVIERRKMKMARLLKGKTRAFSILLVMAVLLSIAALTYAMTPARAQLAEDDDLFSVSPANYPYSLNPGQAIPSSTFTYTVESAGSKHVTFPLTATVTLDPEGSGASLSKSSISLDGYGSDSVTVTGAVPCDQPAGTLQFTVTAESAADNLNPNSKQTHVTITVSSTPEPSCVPSDTTPPVITPTVTATLGLNGWYTSDVTVSWSVSDPESGIASSGGCDSTTINSDTTGTTLTCFATNGAGLTNSVSVTIKRDATAPTVALNPSADSCSLSGNAGWCRGAQTAGFSAHDDTSGVASPCSGGSCDFTKSTTTNGDAVMIASGSVCDVAGNCASSIDAGPYKIDSVAPAITITSPGDGSIYVLNAAQASSYDCDDLTSGVESCSGPVASGDKFDTSTVGSHSFTVNAEDVAGNAVSLTNSYAVQYAPAGTMCLGSASHQVLQPINNYLPPAATSPEPLSVFKRGSTVPVKFRVCDALGNSIGTPGVVSTFIAVEKTPLGSDVPTIAEDIVSTTPDAAFRWDPTSQQWIFNLNTKNLTPNCVYHYKIGLNDGTYIDFYFATK